MVPRAAGRADRRLERGRPGDRAGRHAEPCVPRVAGLVQPAAGRRGQRGLPDGGGAGGRGQGIGGDEIEEELALIRSNEDLMALLDERSREKTTYTPQQ